MGGLKLANLLMPAVLVVLAPVSHAQISRDDVIFAGLMARSDLPAYQQRGGDMSKITPLMPPQTVSSTSMPADMLTTYRNLTHAILLVRGRAWTPASELTTALDFSINAKVFAAGEYLQSRVTFLFDAPPANDAPYRMELEIEKADGSKEASVPPGIVLGDVRGRQAGELIGLGFDPSKLVGPGLHLLRATLKNGNNATLYRYYRTFVIIPDAAKRLDLLEKVVNLLPDQSSPAPLTLRWVMETVALAHNTYVCGGFQDLTGFLYTNYRAAGLGLDEAMDYGAELDSAIERARALKEGHDPLASATGDLHLAYRSSFDGKLVPYRIFIPSNYDKSRKYPLVVLLHGAGADENSFAVGYNKVFLRLAEQRGYILAAANGRGFVSGYAKANGGEQDVLDVTELMQKNYSIDPSRVYLAGHSMGGAGTWVVGLQYRDRYAALAPMAGTGISGNLEAALSAPGRKIPVFISCGGRDALDTVSLCEPVVRKAQALDYPMKYTNYESADHLAVPVVAASDVFDWFDAHVLPAAKAADQP
jgi:pimeloyl-ACP methyl ester carboxylesterase